jgi:acetyl-CoA C-acetyltransferase
MASFDDVVILRLPHCRRKNFKAVSPTLRSNWRAIAVREAVKRAGVDPAQVDECIMGNVVSAGLGQNPARQAAIFGGLSPATGAMTINRFAAPD